MFQSCKWAAGIAALTLGGVMMAAAPALAVGPGDYYVRGYGWGNGTWGRPYFNRGWDGGLGYDRASDLGIPYNGGNYYPAYPGYYYPNGATYPIVPSTSYYYNPSMNITPASYAANQSTSAMIDVQVPADAKVWFGDVPTKQTGAMRSFSSPSLEPNATYHYTIRAQWDDNGKMKEETRSVEVRAGQTSTVDFTRPAGQ